MPEYPIVKSTSPAFETPWFCLDQKSVQFSEGAEESLFYSINEGNHVTVVAQDDAKNILLVRQYRPAVEQFTLELPGGHVENDQPEQSGIVELKEETGYEAGRIQFLGDVIVDTGRNQGRLFCYFADQLTQVGPAEDGIELVYASPAELKDLIVKGAFAHALNMSAVFLAHVKGLLSF